MSNLLSAWNFKARSMGDVWFGCALLIEIIASRPCWVKSILSRPRNVFSKAFPKSLRDWNSGYSLSFYTKYFSQNFAHSSPSCPSNTANRPIPSAKLGFVICASSYKILNNNKGTNLIESPALHRRASISVAWLSCRALHLSAHGILLGVGSIQVD